MSINEIKINPMNKTVLYIDGNNLMMRAYHYAKSKGNDPLFQMISMSYRLKMNYTSHFCFMIFDGEDSKNERLKLSPEYKGNRQNKSEEEKNELKELKEKAITMCKAMGITPYVAEGGIEADDVIAILTKRSIAKNFNVLIITSDKDYKQLCQFSPHVNLINTQSKSNFGNDDILNQDNFFTKNGIEPHMMTDFLALTGDVSDNIKGVEGVGEMTARRLLNEHKSIQKMALALIEDGSLDPKYLVENGMNCVGTPNSFMKDSRVKDKLLEAFMSGSIFRDMKLVGFMYDKENEVKLTGNDIIPNKINIEKLDEFLIDVGFIPFINKHIEDTIRYRQYTRPPHLEQKLQEVKDNLKQIQEQKPTQQKSTNKGYKP